MTTSNGREAVLAAIEDFAREQGMAVEPGARDGEVVVTMPGEHKLKTPCSFLVRDRDVSMTAFVIRRPDENDVAVYRYLLRKNLRTPGLAYAIDSVGDIYLTGRAPLSAVSPEYLDHIFGVLLEGTDGAFNELLVLGFLGSMKREWAWRHSRGESVANLEAFREILQGSEDEEAEAGHPSPAPAPDDDASPGASGPGDSAPLPTAGEVAADWSQPARSADGEN